MHRSASNIRRMSTSLSHQSNSKSSCLGTLASSTEWWPGLVLWTGCCEGCWLLLVVLCPLARVLVG